MSAAAGRIAEATQHQRTSRIRDPHAAGVAGPQRSDRSIVDLAVAVARSQEQLRQAIAEAAYYCAQRRGFAPGNEVEDWLAAQHQIIGQPD